MTYLPYIILLMLLMLSIILLSFAVLAVVLVIDSFVRQHDLPTSRRATTALAQIILQYKPDARNVYDLGCAHGILSFRLARLLPHLTIYAVDDNALRIFTAKLINALLQRRICFINGDIFQIDLRTADVVYTYLWYDHMPLLEKKLQDELQPGAIVITNTSHFHTWQSIDKIITCPKTSATPDFETLFVYIKA